MNKLIQLRSRGYTLLDMKKRLAGLAGS